MISQKLVNRKATTNELRKQITQAELEVEQLKLKLRSEQQKLKMASDELKDVERNLGEIKLRSTFLMNQSTLSNQESSVNDRMDTNHSGRYYQTVVEKVAQQETTNKKRNKTVKFVN